MRFYSLNGEMKKYTFFGKIDSLIKPNKKGLRSLFLKMQFCVTISE